MGALLVAGWYLLLPLAVYIDYYLSFPFWDGLGSVNIIWSICLYFWFSGNLILASKVPLIERWLSYDKRIRLHIATGLAIMVGLVWHVLSKLLAGMEIDWLSWLLLFGCGFFLLMSASWTRMPLLGKLRALLGPGWSKLTNRFYDALRLAHSFGFAVLVGLSWWHIHSAGIDAMGVSGLSGAYIAAAILALSLWLLSWLRRIFAASAVLSDIQVRSDLVLLTLELQRPLRYRAGQFAYLRFPGSPGLQAGHPFSFLSAPEKDGRGQTVQFAVKPQGDFTAALRNLPLGARVRMDGPYGNFRPRAGQKSLLIGTGIGSVPVLSLLAGYAQDQNNWQAIVAVAKAEDLPRQPESDRVALLDFSRDGRLIEKSLLQGAMSGHPDWHVWICSSAKVRQVLLRELGALGVPRRRIHFEAFSFE